jgi:nitroreductase
VPYGPHERALARGTQIVLGTPGRVLDHIEKANLDRCAVAIAVVLLNDRLRFDAGRVAQNMMVAAWALGVGSCPNTVRPDEQDRVRQDLGAPAEAAIATIITLGYPAPGQPRPRPKADPEKIVAKLNRLPLEELVHRERFTG